LTSGYDQFPKYATTAVKVAEDTVAPKLLTAVATDSTTVELTFDEPVDWATNSGGISVNAGSAVSGVNSTVAGNYTYTFTVPALATGANTVQLLNYADFAGNKEALYTTSVNYSANVSTPEVASIKAADSTSFILTLNKAVDTIANTNFTVKEGNYTFTSTDLTVAYVDADGSLTAASGTTPSKYVKVTVPTQAGTANPLYDTNESSAALSVALSGYKNGTVIGKEYNGSVTLSKDLTAPKVVSTKLVNFDKSADTITVPFDKTLAAVADGTKLTVVSGTVKVAASAAVSGKNLVITITDAAGLTDGKYSVVLDKGLVKDGSNNVNEAATLSVDVTSTVATKLLTGSIFGTTSTYDSGKNVITVSYGVKVDDAAASITSYSLNGAALPTGSVAYFTTSAKDTVSIELPASYAVGLNNLSAKISLNANAVKEYSTGNVISSSATEAKAIDQVITLKDNVAPTVSKAEYVKDANGLAIGLKLTFSEAVNTTVVSGVPDLTDDFVVKTGSTVIPYTVGAVTSTDTATDNVVILNFTSVTTAPSGVTVATNVDATKINITDLSTNNKVTNFSVTAQ
jgi:trimeric autotransporter adhesin